MFERLKNNPIGTVLLALLLYMLILRPFLFLTQTYVFFPLLQFLSADVPLDVVNNGRMLVMLVSEGSHPSWSLVFGYVSLAFPLLALLWFRCYHYALWIVWLHVAISLVTFLIFAVSSYVYPEFALLNEWIYKYLMIGLAYAILALGLAEDLKKKRLKSSS